MNWRSQDGVIFIGALIITMFFLTVSLAVGTMSISLYLSTRRTLIDYDTLNAADAGADAFMYNINQNSTYQGTTNAPSTATNSCTGYTISPTTLVNNSTQGLVTYQSCVENGSVSNQKVVNITAQSYLPATATSPISTRKLRLVINGTSTGSSYVLQTGNGGVTANNSTALGAGEFYINGRLLMSNSATIGDASGKKTSDVWVAGYGCGSGASYPSLCSGATGQSDLPIYLSNTAHIYANVHAPNENGGGTDGSNTRKAMTNAGLVDANAPVGSMPSDNRATVMARNTWTSKSASSAACSGRQSSVTWVAGSHFTGSVSISGSCVVNVAGDVWIDGSLQLSNSASLQTASGVSTPPNILIDGQGGFSGSNNSSVVENSSGTPIQIRTFWSSAGTCSTTCPTPTGSALQTSTNTTTISLSNSFAAPGATFYAIWSEVSVSNGTNVGQLIGQEVQLSNSGTITFSGGTVTSGGTTNWNVTHYEETY